MKFALLAVVISACTGIAPKVPTPQPPVTISQAAKSTFRINIRQRWEDGSTLDGKEWPWEDVGSGTAWILRNGPYGSYLMTAGHVCDESEIGEGIVQSYSLTDADGLEFKGVKVERTSEKYDLCLVSYPGYLGAPMPLAAAMPAYDTPVAAVGAPLGVYGCWAGSSVDTCGMAPISRGYFAGGTLVSMPMVGGNSGSAVFASDGVFGVLIEAYRGFDSLGFVEPIDHIQNFLD